MGQNLRIFIIISTILLLIDFYTWQGVKFLTHNWTDRSKFILKASYWGYTALSFVFFLAWRMGWIHLSRQLLSIIMAITFVIIVAKVVWCVFLLIDDLVRLGKWIAQSFNNQSVSLAENQPVDGGISRLKFLNYTGLGIGAAFVGTAVWGIAKGAHNYQVR